MRKGGFHNTESGLNSAESNELFFFFWTGALLLVMCVLLLQCACLPKDKILFLSFSEETKDLIFPLLLNNEWSSFRSLSYSEQDLICAIRETDFPISLCRSSRIPLRQLSLMMERHRRWNQVLPPLATTTATFSLSSFYLFFTQWNGRFQKGIWIRFGCWVSFKDLRLHFTT